MALNCTHAPRRQGGHLEAAPADGESRRAARRCRTALSAALSLENELQSKLHDAWVMSIRCRQKIARTEGSPYVVELRMVESVVSFPSEFDGRGLF